MEEKKKVPRAKARFGFGSRIIVEDCPYCHRQHVHYSPVGEGQHAADCFLGEYILDFSEDEEERNVNLQ